MSPDQDTFEGGSGPVGVLVLHGFTADPKSVRGWASGLAEAGYRVIAPRMPGHGTRWQDLTITSWQDWYARASRSLDELLVECETVFVAGLSMGGAIALLLAERRTQDVAGLLLVNPALHAMNPLAPPAGMLRPLVRSVGSEGSDIARPTDSSWGYDRTPTAGVAELNRLWGVVRPNLDLVTCPILLMTSASDHVVPPASANLIRRQTSSMDVTEVSLPRSFHVATVDYDARLIITASLDFLAKHTDTTEPTDAPAHL